ncbi:MAG: S-methyl-5'-thioadenosine phosphorylase [Aquificota bacterium]|nr:MAG: S-methyl-5'-thioadenosine phosphorylase [Aquificota bacterium]
MEKPILGIIGGSGLYQMEEGLEIIEEVNINTPFGPPSDSFVLGKLEGVPVAFLARHGKGHRLMPSEINYRANIYGMKVLGVQWLISISAVGSMKEEIEPGHMVVPHQFIDWTRKRVSTFFGDGLVAHVSMADPVCPILAKILAEEARAAGATVHEGGTYLCMEGPQFSSRAESFLYRSWGVSVIGMTNMPEVKLAREAEMCYATLAMSTDYDCWHQAEEDVTVEMVIQTLMKNVKTAQAVVRRVAARLPVERNCPCPTALEHALITQEEAIPDETYERLKPLVGKYIPRS